MDICTMDVEDFPEERKSNARLIAAAPELAEVAVQSLRAMQTARKQLEPGTVGFDVLTTTIEKARAALRKAGILEDGKTDH